MSFPDRVTTPLGPSLVGSITLAAVSLAAAAVPWGIGMPTGLAAVASLILAGWGGRLVRRDALGRGPSAWVGLEMTAAGRGELLRRDGARIPVTLRDDAWAGPWCVVFPLKSPEPGARSVVVWRDSVPPRAFRRLRVIARRAGRAASEELPG